MNRNDVKNVSRLGSYRNWFERSSECDKFFYIIRKRPYREYKLKEMHNKQKAITRKSRANMYTTPDTLSIIYTHFNNTKAARIFHPRYIILELIPITRTTLGTLYRAADEHVTSKVSNVCNSFVVIAEQQRPLWLYLSVAIIVIYILKVWREFEELVFLDSYTYYYKLVRRISLEILSHQQFNDFTRIIHFLISIYRFSSIIV